MIDRLSSLFIVVIIYIFIKENKIIRILFFLMLVFIIYCLIIAIMSTRDIKTIIKDEMNLDISKCELIRDLDTHGGMGDGESLYVYDCSYFQDYYLEQVNDWTELPMSRNLTLIMYGGVEDGISYSYNLAKEVGIPYIKNGYYYFINNNDYTIGTDCHSDKYLFDGYSYNFVLAIYDIDTNLFYYYKFDT